MYTIKQIILNNKYSLNTRINLKGYIEQENCYLFSGLYGSKKLTKNTIGNYKTFNKQNKIKI